MTLFAVVIFFSILFAIELVYFKMANRFNIVDKPNRRSSHTKVTIRGGGIIFIMGFILSWVYGDFQYGYFLTGLLLIGGISFIDDISPVSKRLRIALHFIGAALLLYQVGLYSYPPYWILFGFIFVIGTINGTNFMDGINGITGGYSLLVLLTLFYINKYVILFSDEKYLAGVILALLVFNFFNFRKRAKCFAGDVGSVSIAFITAFFILQLVVKSNQPGYLLLLTVYIADTLTTILFRMIRRENIFEAHRSHFYQFLANERQLSQLLVAGLYIVSQGVINILLVMFSPVPVVNLFIILVLSIVTFILIRFVSEGRQRILNL